MFWTRFVTASIFSTIFFTVLFWGGHLGMMSLAASVCAIAGWEWAKINGASMPSIQGAAIGAAIVTIESLTYLAPIKLALMYCAVLWLVLLPWILIRHRDVRQWFGLSMIALVSLGLSLLALHAIHPMLLVSVLVLVWIADSFAYFTGKLIGKHKMVPKISPGKTWEGLAGAGVATLIYANLAGLFWADSFFYKLYHVSQFGWLILIVATVLLTALSVAGDLFESLLKRQAGIKDSSQLLPGHGGFFDRIDALVPVLPLALLMFKIIA